MQSCFGRLCVARLLVPCWRGGVDPGDFSWHWIPAACQCYWVLKGLRYLVDCLMCLLPHAQIMVLEGLHPFYDERVRDLLDFKIYLDISDEVSSIS